MSLMLYKWLCAIYLMYRDRRKKNFYFHFIPLPTYISCITLTVLKTSTISSWKKHVNTIEPKCCCYQLNDVLNVTQEKLANRNVIAIYAHSVLPASKLIFLELKINVISTKCWGNCVKYHIFPLLSFKLCIFLCRIESLFIVISMLT